MVERQLPKLHTRVRFPSPAPVGSPRAHDLFWPQGHLGLIQAQLCRVFCLGEKEPADLSTSRRLDSNHPWLPLAGLWFFWMLVSAAVIATYAEHHHFGWRLLVPHLAVVSCLFALLVIASLSTALTRLPSVARRTMRVAVLAGGHVMPYWISSAALLRSFEWTAGMLSARYGSWTRVWRVTVLVTGGLACPTLLMQAAGAGTGVAVRLNEPFFRVSSIPAGRLKRCASTRWP